MRTLKPQNHEQKINKVKIRRGADCEQYPAFSFQYLTTNSSYNFDFFTRTMTQDKKEAQCQLVEKINELSRHTWQEISGLGKGLGYETLENFEVSFSPNFKGKHQMSADSKYIVIQFNHHRMRIIGVRIDSCPILYIVGYDFDFSAYHHG